MSELNDKKDVALSSATHKVNDEVKSVNKTAVLKNAVETQIIAKNEQSTTKTNNTFNKVEQQVSLGTSNSSFSDDQKDEKENFMLSIKKWWDHLTKKVRLALLFIVLPTILFFLYSFFWASPMYISETKFAVRSASTSTAGVDFASQVFKIPSSSLQDAKIVEEYLKSIDAFNDIDKELSLVSHYSSSDYDLFSRLWKDPTVNEKQSFWNKVSFVTVNQDSNVVIFSVRAYTPDMAYNIASTALKESETLINKMNEKAREDAISIAQNEVKASEARLALAQDNLKNFRNKYKDLDLKSTATSYQSTILELEAKATELRTQISSMQAYMNENAPQITFLKSQLSGIEKQIAKEKSNITAATPNGDSVNNLVAEYQRLIVEEEFANKQLVFSMTSLEQAKLEAQAKSLYVVTVSNPTMPDEDLYPEPFLFTLYLFLALSMIFIIVSVINAAIKEHFGY